MRYFFGGYDAAGYMLKLSNSMIEKGNKVRYKNLGEDRYDYSKKGKLHSEIKVKARTKERRRYFTKIINFINLLLYRIWVITNEINRSDVFIITGYQGIINFHELVLLKLLGKKIIIIFLGSDARPPYLSGKHLDDRNGIFDSNQIMLESKNIKKRIKRVEKYADIIVNNPATSQFFERECIDFLYLGFPLPKINEEKNEYEDKKTIRVLHAPSRPVAKGSNEFSRIIEKLQKNGHEIEYKTIVNMPNWQLMKEIAKCDLILDELYSDMPIATFGVEASLLAKPVIVGTYFKEYIEKFTASDIVPPTLFVNPRDAESEITKIINNKSELKKIGKLQQKFVNENYNPDKIVEKIKKMVSGEVDKKYYYNPKEIEYILGWGVSNIELRKQLKKYIKDVGEKNLYLEHNKKIGEKITKFINEENEI